MNNRDDTSESSDASPFPPAIQRATDKLREMAEYCAGSLWERCFWEEFEACKSRGEDSISFANVEKRVIEKAKLEITKLLEYLGRS